MNHDRPDTDGSKSGRFYGDENGANAPLQSGTADAPIDKFFRAFRRFARLEAASGILLMACAVVAMVWGNSPWSDSYARFWHTELTIGVKHFHLSKSLLHWINDGLMTVFFFVVGLEIKREMLVGGLASAKRAALPIMAALGGMLVPAVLYACFNAGKPGARGWGIPMATDVAFSLGVLALLGKRVPFALRMFLVALAIADDLGAVLVIALFYTSQISWTSLAVAGAFLFFLLVVNQRRIPHPLPYLILGFGRWHLTRATYGCLTGVGVGVSNSPVPSPRVRRRVPPKAKTGGRAAIRRTELLWCNEASDTVACGGESSSPHSNIHSGGLASCP